MPFYKTLSKFVEDNHLNQAAVAREMGIDSAKLNATVNGKRKMDVDEFLSFCKATRIKPAELLQYGSR